MTFPYYRLACSNQLHLPANTRRWLNVGPSSATMAQHWANASCLLEIAGYFGVESVAYFGASQHLSNSRDHVPFSPRHVYKEYDINTAPEPRTHVWRWRNAGSTSETFNQPCASVGPATTASCFDLRYVIWHVIRTSGCQARCKSLGSLQPVIVPTFKYFQLPC